MAKFDKLDPLIINCEPRTTSIEEFESIPLDPRNPFKSLQVRKDLPTKVKKKLKRFLYEKFNVFACRNEDMVGIDTKISFHLLKIDLGLP